MYHFKLHKDREWHFLVGRGLGRRGGGGIPKCTDVARFGNYFNRLACFDKVFRFTDNAQLIIILFPGSDSAIIA